MAKDSGTRSGLLWEVERILLELHRGGQPLPQILLMENVPEVVGTKNIKHFAEWIKSLEQLGYKNKYKIINATDFGVPQNRERCFMVSWLGDYYYDFPRPIGCKRKLKDLLERDVPESYYLKEGTIIKLNEHKERHEAQGHGFGWKPTTGGGTLTPLRQRAATDPIATLLLSNKGKDIVKETDTAGTLMARDYKGFGNQPMNAVMEIPPPAGHSEG